MGVTKTHGKELSAASLMYQQEELPRDLSIPAVLKNFQGKSSWIPMISFNSGKTALSASCFIMGKYQFAEKLLINTKLYL